MAWNPCSGICHGNVESCPLSSRENKKMKNPSLRAGTPIIPFSMVSCCKGTNKRAKNQNLFEFFPSESTFDGKSKVRISERKTKIYLTFFRTDERASGETEFTQAIPSEEEEGEANRTSSEGRSDAPHRLCRIAREEGEANESTFDWRSKVRISEQNANYFL